MESKDSGRRTGLARRFVYSFVAVLAVLAACASGSGQRKDDAAPAGAACSSDADCRLVSDYCEGCACRALATGEADPTLPTCKGTIVQCFVDPCRGQRAVCTAGACVTAR